MRERERARLENVGYAATDVDERVQLELLNHFKNSNHERGEMGERERERDNIN